MRRGLIVTLAVAGVIVAVGLTLAASSLADQGIPREGHGVPIVRVETGPSPMILPSAAPGSALAPTQTQGGVQTTGSNRHSTKSANASPTPSSGASGGSRFSDDHGNPGSDD
jgi:hypothetical protein